MIDEQIRNDRKNNLEFVGKYSHEKNKFLKGLREKKPINYQKIYDKIDVKNALNSVSTHQRQLIKRWMA